MKEEMKILKTLTVRKRFQNIYKTILKIYLRYIYQKEKDEDYFQHDMNYRDFKCLPK